MGATMIRAGLAGSGLPLSLVVLPDPSLAESQRPSPARLPRHPLQPGLDPELAPSELDYRSMTLRDQGVLLAQLAASGSSLGAGPALWPIIPEEQRSQCACCRLCSAQNDYSVSGRPEDWRLPARPPARPPTVLLAWCLLAGFVTF